VTTRGRLLPEGEIGNCASRATRPWPTTGNQHEKTKATLFGEWIQTGDKYYGQGRLLLVLAAGPTTCSRSAASGSRPWSREHPVGHARPRGRGGGHEDTDRLVKPKAFVVLKDGHAPRAGSRRSSRPS